jgi:hypothetical protein
LPFLPIAIDVYRPTSSVVATADDVSPLPVQIGSSQWRTRRSPFALS